MRGIAFSKSEEGDIILRGEAAWREQQSAQEGRKKRRGERLDKELMLEIAREETQK